MTSKKTMHRRRHAGKDLSVVVECDDGNDGRWKLQKCCELGVIDLRMEGREEDGRRAGGEATRPRE